MPFVGSSTAGLVVASQCLHWFDVPKFYDELDRVLVPGGFFVQIKAWTLMASKEQTGHEAITEAQTKVGILRKPRTN